MTQLKMLSADDKLAEIRRLYFNASKATIENDLTKALDLLKSMETEDERERATVFMEGLSEMRRDWERERAPKSRPGGGGASRGGAKKSARAGAKSTGRSGPKKAAPRAGAKSAGAKAATKPRGPKR